MNPVGPSWDILHQVAALGDFKLKLQPITNTSIVAANRSMDTWWGCINDIAVNHTDLCVGDFWVTKERSAYLSSHGTFTIPYSSSSFYLISKISSTTQSDAAWEWSNPLKPFDYEFWAVVTFVFIFSALSYVFVESFAGRRRRLALNRPGDELLVGAGGDGVGGGESAGNGLEGSSRDSVGDPGKLQQQVVSKEQIKLSATPSSRLKLMAEAAERKRKKWVTDFRKTVVAAFRGGNYNNSSNHVGADAAGANITDSLYINLVSVHQTLHEPKSHGGRLVQMAFGLFLMLATQYWGSIITAGIVVNSQVTHAGPKSLEEASRLRHSVCAPGWIGDEIVKGTLYPEPTSKWNPSVVSSVVVPNSKLKDNTMMGSLNAMDAGECKHTVGNFDMFKHSIATKHMHCDKGIIGGQVIVPAQVSFPVRAELEPVISALVLRVTTDYQKNMEKEEIAMGLSCDPTLEGKDDMSATKTPVYRIRDLSTVGVIYMSVSTSATPGVIKK